MTALFIGNESLTIECARMWREAGHEVTAIATSDPDVAAWAQRENLRVEPAGKGLAEHLQGLSVDWLFSVAYLNLIPDAVLALAKNGGINFHDGPLPKHAGLNAPVWALLEGDRSHGITWHKITAGVDEGDILIQRRFDIQPNDTALTLNTRCFEAAMESFPAVIKAVAEGPDWHPQDFSQRSLHARADRPANAGVIDFQQGSADIAAFVRALDHGTYWNPLSAAKLILDGQIILVGTAYTEITKETGEPGTVLSRGDSSLSIATGTGAIRLGDLRDTTGTPLVDLPEAGAICAPVAGDANADLVDAVRNEPFWRARLQNMRPADPGFVTRHRGAQHRSIPLKTNRRDRDALRLLAGLWAARACGEAHVDLAYQTKGDAPLLQSSWVPLPIIETEGQTLQAARDHLAETVGRLGDKGGFVCDLIARDPAISPVQPLIGLNEATEDLVTGTVLSIVLNGPKAVLVYDAAAVDDAMAQLLADRFEALCMAEPSTPLRDLPRMAEAERAMLVTDLNRTGKPYDPAPMHRMFEAQAARTPKATAVVFEGQSISYAGLNQRANQVAHVLQAMGIGSGALVGLSTRRSLDMIVGALGILKAGGAYVPMDPAYPADRLALYAEDSGARVIVTQSDLAHDLPETSAEHLVLDTDPRISAAPDTNPDAEVSPGDLAYMIYTSGSTGRPKGVMVEHRNFANFFAGMDDRIDHSDGSVWLAVTSLNFDISVLELFWTLARGFKLVISSDENRALVSSVQLATSDRGMEFSLFYWGNDDGVGRDKYRLLLEGAKFADKNGFCAVWTPERHFHAFGGPYPNPSVTGAAVAAVTENLSVRAGSCVAPLHHTARIAEEWAVIDNLTNGRAALAIASGWQPDDFVLRPENTPPQNKPAMYDAIRDLRALWQGKEVEFARADGTPHKVLTQPRPVSKELPIWVTTAGNPQTWKEAGEIGANVLTHLLGQSIDEVAEKITIYHQALRDAGRDPADHKVTLMLHSYIAATREEAEEIARAPMKDYLRAAAGLIKQYAWAFPAFKKPKGVNNPFELDLDSLSPEEMDSILDFAFARYFEESGLFGTVDDCVAKVEALKKIGVDEVACLIDYGIAVDTVLEGLKPLARVVAETNRDGTIPADDHSIAAQILRHNVTHMQCTPSMARMIAMNDEARSALGRVKHLLLGGEPLPGALVSEFAAITDAPIENMYGPTETTIWSSTAKADKGDGIVDIGTPIANTQFYVLDEQMTLAPVGVAGELWIGGDGVTRGYWQREDLTSDRFRDDPFRDGGRIYGTGDLVRRRADGSIDFIGRADGQVKLRGYRIELGEIEATLETLDGVDQAVVILREDTPGDKRLVGYVRSSSELGEPAMKAALSDLLPPQMVPGRIVPLDSFPLTPNRKVDRKALPAPGLTDLSQPEPDQPASDTDSEASDTVARVGAIWSRLLGVGQVGAGSNFFELGGHSLLAVQAHREIKAELGLRKLSITDIFRFPTLGRLSAQIDKIGGATPSAAPITPQERTPARPVQTAPIAANDAGTAQNNRPRADRIRHRTEAMTRRRALREARRS